MCKPFNFFIRRLKVKYIAPTIFVVAFSFTFPRFFEWDISIDWIHWCIDRVKSNETDHFDEIFLDLKVFFPVFISSGNFFNQFSYLSHHYSSFILHCIAHSPSPYFLLSLSLLISFSFFLGMACGIHAIPVHQNYHTLEL